MSDLESRGQSASAFSLLRPTELSGDVVTCLIFLEEFVQFSGISRKVIESFCRRIGLIDSINLIYRLWKPTFQRIFWMNSRPRPLSDPS